MKIYLNGVRWNSPASSNAKYPYTEMEVGDKAVIVPRSNISPHQLDHFETKVRSSAYQTPNNDPSYRKTFSTRKAWLTSVSDEKIGDRPAFIVTRKADRYRQYEVTQSKLTSDSEIDAYKKGYADGRNQGLTQAADLGRFDNREG